jgi:hypothetical protein
MKNPMPPHVARRSHRRDRQVDAIITDVMGPARGRMMRAAGDGHIAYIWSAEIYRRFPEGYSLPCISMAQHFALVRRFNLWFAIHDDRPA